MKRVSALITTIALLAAAGAAAQSASAPELKAAFLFNFAKFAEWPSLAPDAPVAVCVAGDDRVATVLSETVRGQAPETRAVTVIKLPGDVPTRACQVLFVGSGADARRRAALLEEAAAGPVLTVSDSVRFAVTGGMVELFLESGRMRFAINVDAVGRSRVRLSSRLLGLAKIVRDTTNAQ